jgi:hypothetical protein
MTPKPVHVLLHGGHVISVQAGFDEDALVRVVAVLGQRWCLACHQQ